jgi:DNA-directed RNA polymerase specialized sigma24 family protein
MTPAAFGKLLSCLHADHERSGEEYEKIRQKLIVYFEGRRCSPADEHADEVINRVARKIDEGEEVRDINRYVFGVARFLRLEVMRQPRSEVEPDSHLDRLIALPNFEVEREDRLTFLDRCLEKLPPESKQMILEYYQGEKREKIDNRGLMAKRYGLSTNGLKIRICRIRTKLEDCIKECLRRSSEPA